MIYETCPVCSSSIMTWKVKKVGGETYRLDRCGPCGYAFVNPRPTMEFVKHYYVSGSPTGGNPPSNLICALKQERDYPNSTIDAARMITTIKSLTSKSKNKRFLDVGCGEGFFSREALFAGFNVYALELAAKARRITKELTGIDAVNVPFEEFECAAGSMGVVLMSQVLEHALDVNAWIKKAYDILADGGVIAIALPNFGSLFRMVMQENEPYICPPDHLNFFSVNNLSRLFKNNGFKVELTQSVSRLPIRAFEKRLPSYATALLPIINIASIASLATIDAFGVGIMINAYGRKI
jgi:SAM-dependent methyltransferase